MPAFQSDLLRIRDAVMRNEGDPNQLVDAAKFLDHECDRFSDMVRMNFNVVIVHRINRLSGCPVFGLFRQCSDPLNRPG